LQAGLLVPVVYNRMPRIAATAPMLVERALAKTAFDVTTDAILAAPVDTGNLVASISAAPHGALEWRVTAHAEYAVYVELGTRHASAQPFLLPALRQRWPKMMDALRSSGIVAR
jgi:HK97 gp10 family phage protein